MKPWHMARRKHDGILQVNRIIRTFVHKPYQICFLSNIPGICDLVHANSCPPIFSISHWTIQALSVENSLRELGKFGIFLSCNMCRQDCSEDCKVVLMIEDVALKIVKLKTIISEGTPEFFHVPFSTGLSQKGCVQHLNVHKSRFQQEPETYRSKSIRIQTHTHTQPSQKKGGMCV